MSGDPLFWGPCAWVLSEGKRREQALSVIARGWGVGLALLGSAAADDHAMTPPTLRGLGNAGDDLGVNLVGYGVARRRISVTSDTRTEL